MSDEPRAMNTFQHVYIVIRVDPERHETFVKSGEPVEWEFIVTTKRVVFSEEDARHEVERLNRLHGDRGSIYFYQKAKVIQEDYGKWPKMQSRPSTG